MKQVNPRLHKQLETLSTSYLHKCQRLLSFLGQQITEVNRGFCNKSNSEKQHLVDLTFDSRHSRLDFKKPTSLTAVLKINKIWSLRWFRYLIWISKLSSSFDEFNGEINANSIKVLSDGVINALTIPYLDSLFSHSRTIDRGAEIVCVMQRENNLGFDEG